MIDDLAIEFETCVLPRLDHLEKGKLLFLHCSSFKNLSTDLVVGLCLKNQNSDISISYQIHIQKK